MRNGIAGIYKITVARDGKTPRHYIGQSCHLKDRKATHRRELHASKHRNPLLQSAFDKYGADAFSFEIVLICEKNKETLSMYEQDILNFYLSEHGEEGVYNCHKQCVSSALGTKRSDEQRAKMSAAQKGKKLSPEQIELMRTANLGRKLSPESIAKRTAKQTGRVVSAETRKKHANAILGIKRSDETRARISAAKKGQGPSPEHMERLRLANIGRKRTPDQIEKTVSALRGKKKSPEEIARRQATRAANKAVKLAT